MYSCTFSYLLKIISDNIQRDDLTDAELQGVAEAVQRTGKLKELADALEVVPLLKALEEEEETNSTLKLLQHWHRGLKGSLEVHSILVHHLRCIGLEGTADKYVLECLLLDVIIIMLTASIFYIRLLYSTLQSNTVSSSTEMPTAVSYKLSITVQRVFGWL